MSSSVSPLNNSARKVAVFGNVYQKKKSHAAHVLFQVLHRLDVQVSVQEDFHDFLREQISAELVGCTTFSGGDFNADLVISMGGDGTFLNVASLVGARQIPMMGINTGRLGFLANIQEDDVEKAVSDFLAGRHQISQHTVLQLDCQELKLQGYPFALNEIAILKHDISSMISIHTRINGKELTTYQADGLLVSTPTGSTAYSLSVGGPIIVPQCNTMLLCPVAPHSLNMRPIVLTDDIVLELDVDSRSHSFLVAVDGRSNSYPDSIHLTIRKAPYHVYAVSLASQDYFSTIRRKMMWGADMR